MTKRQTIRIDKENKNILFSVKNAFTEIASHEELKSQPRSSQL
jgi:hypothetical protein